MGLLVSESLVTSNGHALLRRPVARFEIPFTRVVCLSFCSKTDVIPWDVERFLIVAHRAHERICTGKVLISAHITFKAGFSHPHSSRCQSANFRSQARPRPRSFYVELS